jgi:parallel beta-helix repeat protein
MASPLVIALLAAAALPSASSPCDVVVPAVPGAADIMVRGLQAGQTACRAAGRHAGDIVIRRRAIVLRAAPEARATLAGQLRIAKGADDVTVTGLFLDGTNPGGRPSPLVNANRASFTANDVTNRSDSCFVLGDKEWGVAADTVIAGNHIHDCGVPNTNQDHGVYVRQATGTRIEGNVIRRNADRGVQLYPNADGSLVRGNVLDDNGEGVIFSGDRTDVSSANRVEGNIITFSRLRHDVESWWTAGNRGKDNVVRSNCVFGGRRGGIQQPQVGFSASRNTVSDPRYASRSGASYRLRGDSPCKVRPPVLAQHLQ